MVLLHDQVRRILKRDQNRIFLGHLKGLQKAERGGGNTEQAARKWHARGLEGQGVAKSQLVICL